MKEKELEQEGVVISIPKGTKRIEIVATVRTKKGKKKKYSAVIEGEELEEAREIYEDNCVRYYLTDKGREMLRNGCSESSESLCR